MIFGLSNFTKLHHLLDADSPYAPSPAAIWQHMAQAVPEFADLTFNGIPATGVVVSDHRFAALEFVDGPSIHFQPKNAAVEA